EGELVKRPRHDRRPAPQSGEEEGDRGPSPPPDVIEVVPVEQLAPGRRHADVEAQALEDGEVRRIELRGLQLGAVEEPDEEAGLPLLVRIHKFTHGNRLLAAGSPRPAGTNGPTVGPRSLRRGRFATLWLTGR